LSKSNGSDEKEEGVLAIKDQVRVTTNLEQGRQAGHKVLQVNERTLE
jgi:hypothetical protein